MKIKEENMKSFEEFAEEFNKAGSDPERYNKVLTERAQQYINKISGCIGDVAEGDLPFLLVALTAFKATYEKQSDDRTKQVTRYLMENMKVLCIHRKYTKTVK